MSDLLVRYMDGDLTGAEKIKLEESLGGDPVLRAEYDSLLQTRAAIRHYGLRQKVATLHHEMMEEMKTPVRKLSPVNKTFRYGLAIAASIVLLVGAWFAYQFFTLSPGKVFSANYRSYEPGTLRDGGSMETTGAENAYREKNYQEVIRIHDAGKNLTPRIEFLCGVAALELHDDAKAIQCFREVLHADATTGEGIMKDEAEYYLSLSYIRNRDFDFALPILLKIKNDPEHKYNSEVSSRLIWKVKMLKWR